MDDEARRLRARAKDYLDAAARSPTSPMREKFLRLAADYEQLANDAERNERKEPPA